MKEPRRAFLLFCVSLIALTNETTKFFFSFRAEAILLLPYTRYEYYIFLAVGTRLTENAIPPEPVCYTSAVYLTKKLTLTAIFLVLLTDHFTAFFNPTKASRDERYK